MKEAKLGDTVVCRGSMPHNYTITVKLEAPEQVAEINKNLLSDNPLWEIKDRADQ